MADYAHANPPYMLEMNLDFVERRMAGAAQTRPAMSIELFRAFYESRPDEEHWELIDGVAMKMATAKVVHQRVASNLERILNDALEAYRPGWAAYQRIGLNLRPFVDAYDPEPDVVVADVVHSLDLRYVDRFYLAAEVVSDSDRRTLEAKRGVYKVHPSCNCVLTIRQDRTEVRIDARQGAEWQLKILRNAADVLELREFGLRCTVGDLYKGTPLAPPR